MNFFNIFGIFLFVVVIFGISAAHAEIDPFSEIIFLQSGILQTEENEFLISNEFNIREFFNGNIVRVSGQTIEGFPYITYSRMSDQSIDTQGVIFISGQFVKLSFMEKPIENEDIEEKVEDILITTQYTQRAHSKQFVFIDVKIFEKEENKNNDFNQNYAYVTNTNIQVVIVDENLENIFTATGITNDKGLFETKYLIPDNSKRETLTITINAENDNSSTSKILQMFSLGNIPSDGKS